MAKRNFTVIVAMDLLLDYAAVVVAAAAQSNIILTEVVYEDDGGTAKRGNKEVWRLAGRSGSGKSRKKHSVTAYEGGSVTFQNIEIGTFDISENIVNKW